MKSLTMTLIALSVSLTSVFAGYEVIDGKEYWRDEAGTLHQYLYLNSFASSSVYTGKYRSAPGSSEELSWIDGSVLVLSDQSDYKGSSGVFYAAQWLKAYGVVIQQEPPDFRANDNSMEIGGLGIQSGLDTLLMLKGTKKYKLTASQIWSGPEESSDSFKIAVANNGSGDGLATKISAVAGTTWTLAGNAMLLLYTAENELGSCDVVVKDPAIIALTEHNDRQAVLGARKLTIDGGIGMTFGKCTTYRGKTVNHDVINWIGASTYEVGSVPVITPARVAPTIELKNGAALTAVSETSVSGGVTISAIDATPVSMVGVFRFDDAQTVIRVDDGATLDLTGATFAGAGKPTLSGAGTIVIAGNEAFGHYVLDPSATLNVKIASGVAFFEGAAALPEGVTFETAGSGRLFLTQTAGFDFTPRLGGTRAVEGGAGSLYVNDTVREGETLAVGGSAVLKVYGDGLKSGSTVNLASGAAIEFFRTATIGAALVASGKTTFLCENDDVIGTIAGAFDYVEGKYGDCDIKPKGVIRFACGGTRAWGQTIMMRGGTAEVVSKKLTFDGGWIHFYGGCLRVADGGEIEYLSSWQNIEMDLEAQNADAVLEIAEGGVFRMKGSDSQLLLGRNANYSSKLLISGGTYYHGNDGFVLDYYGTGNGVVEIASGCLETPRRITCKNTTGTAKLILGDGVLKAVGGETYQASLVDGSGQCEISVVGNAMLDLSQCEANLPDGKETGNCRWTSEDGARLAVKGHANTLTTFTVHGFDVDGLMLDLQNRVSMNIVDAASPLRIGYVVSGNANAKVVAVGGSPDLTVDYVVPQGGTLDLDSMPPWHQDFGSVTVRDLVLENGSTVVLPCFGSAQPLAVAGKVVLADEMSYRIKCLGARKTVSDVPVLVPALGFSGTGSWACAGGVRPERATLSVGDGALLFSYDAPGFALLLR